MRHRARSLHAAVHKEISADFEKSWNHCSHKSFWDWRVLFNCVLDL